MGRRPLQVVGSVLGAVFSGAGEAFNDLAIVVELDEPVARLGKKASFVALHQDREAGWFRRTGTVDIELCDFEVVHDHREDRRRGEFAEGTVP